MGAGYGVREQQRRNGQRVVFNINNTLMWFVIYETNYIMTMTATTTTVMDSITGNFIGVVTVAIHNRIVMIAMINANTIVITNI